MKNGLRKGISLLSAVLFMLAVLCAAPAGAKADGAESSCSGTTAAETTFYVSSTGGAVIRLEARPGTAYTENYDYLGRLRGYKQEEVYGFFRVLVTKGTSSTLIWAPSASAAGNAANSTALVIPLPEAGQYQVTVTPLSASEINGVYWFGNRFQYWLANASWALTYSTNCYCGLDAGSLPVQRSGQVTVYCYDQNGNFIKTYTETVTNGRMIYPTSISGYTAESSAQYVSCVGGTCSPASLTFYYSRAQQPSYGTVRIVCYDANGTQLRSDSKTLSSGQTIYPPNLTGYTAISSGQYVYCSNGICTPSEVSFYYRRSGGGTIITPTPVPVTQAPVTPVPVTPVPITPAPASTITPIPASAGADPRGAYPYAWDTQFRDGNSTKNNTRFPYLTSLFDGNPSTSFFWTFWNSECGDAIPEFTAFFNGDTVSTIGLRNGRNSNYGSYGRIRSLRVVVYDREGRSWSRTFDPADDDSYHEYSLGATYTNVDRIELWVDKIRAGSNDSYKYEIHVAEIQFFQ